MQPSSPLKRRLKLPVVTFFGVGAILGAGIYVLIGEVTAVAGYYLPLSFLLAAVIALFSALSYAELSARFPRAAGAAVYIDEAFRLPWLTQLIALLVVFTGVVSAATMSTGVVGYVQLFLEWPAALVIILFSLVVGAIAAWGIEEAAWVVVVITLLEVSGLLYVVFIAADSISIASWSEQWSFSSFDSSVATGLLLGGFLAFYAYIGFEDMVNVAEEVQQPEIVLPRAIILALVIATVIYMMVAIAALSVLAPEKLAASEAPLAAVVQAKGRSTAWIGLISLVAVINGAIVQLIMASRVLYGMASRNLLPSWLAKVNAATGTPVAATTVCMVITCILALLFPLAILAQTTSVIILSLFALVNVSLLRVHRRAPYVQTISFPNWVPWVGFLLCIGILLLKAALFFRAL